VTCSRKHLCGLRHAREQPETPDKQDQRHDGIEKARRLEINVHVRNHAGEDEERTAGREQPTKRASAAPEQHADAHQHGNERDAESIGAVEAPVGAAHDYLIGHQVSSDTGHGEAHEELADADSRPIQVARMIACHDSEDISLARTCENES
jgi:hypothetical protein